MRYGNPYFFFIFLPELYRLHDYAHALQAKQLARILVENILFSVWQKRFISFYESF
jgi:hypothetical protein